MRPIYLIIGLLAIVLVYLLFFSGKKTPAIGQFGATPGTLPTGTTPTSGTTSLVASVSSILQSEPPPSISTCRKTCNSICKPCPGGSLFKCGSRCTCERNCRSSCSKNEAYKDIYPICG